MSKQLYIELAGKVAEYLRFPSVQISSRVATIQRCYADRVMEGWLQLARHFRWNRRRYLIEGAKRLYNEASRHDLQSIVKDQVVLVSTGMRQAVEELQLAALHYRGIASRAWSVAVVVGKVTGLWLWLGSECGLCAHTTFENGRGQPWKGTVRR